MIHGVRFFFVFANQAFPTIDLLHNVLKEQQMTSWVTSVHFIRRFGKIDKKRKLASSCVSVCPYGTLGGFS